MRRAVGFLVALGVLALASTPLTLARFVDAAISSATLAADTLDPPTSLAASAGSGVSLTWVPTIDAYASGYSVLRSATSGSGYAVVGTVTPASATSTTDAPVAGTWYYVLQSVFENWTSGPSNEASVIVLPAQTALTGCASQAADSGGDNDGYESNPARACGDPNGAIAQDTNSGTNLLDQCPNTGKDRHRFWGFGTGLPSSVTTIHGIEVELTAGMNNNGGTSRLCVELSWDGGTSWTAIQSVPLTDLSLTTYLVGAADDTWGRAWTRSEFDAPNLQVRLTMVSTQPNKAFRLDAVRVRVSYTP